MKKLDGSRDGVRNDGTKPAEVWDGNWKDPDLLQPGYIRFYEFMHGYKDIPIKEHEASIARHRAVMNGEVQPTPEEEMGKILTEEIQKEINREIIRKICGKAT